MKTQMRKDGVSPVIAVILMVAITVVLAGVLYVWVTSLADTDDTVDKLRLDIDDGKTNIGSDGSAFGTADIFLKLEQTGGDPIDWSGLTIICEDTETGDRAELVIINCKGTAYNPTDNKDTKTGEVVELGVKLANDFQSGDRVDLTITKGDDQVYKSQAIRVN